MASFALDISKFVEKVKDQGETVLRKVALDMGSAVVLKSPVDTGRFRGNWQFGVGAVNPAVDNTLGQAKGIGGGAAAALSMARMEAGAGVVKLGDVVYISNSLPYANRLEYGHSKQAPLGMVRITVEEYQMIFDKAAASG